MESIKYYKLISPYPEDITMDCKLSMSDVDSNFLMFKDYDIKDASYDSDNMVIEIIRNNGETINIDLSSLKDFVDNEIIEALSEYTPGVTNIELNGTLSDNGVLTLKWMAEDGQKQTQISGFLTKNDKQIYHDETLTGTGEKYNPIGVTDNEKTGKYKAALGVVDSLPTINLNPGDRWITHETFHLFGRMYNINALGQIKEALNEEGGQWRIPAKEDWDALFEYSEMCESGLSPFNIDYGNNDLIGQYVGDIAGAVLKTVDFWEGDENFNNLNFSVVPAGYVTGGNLDYAGTQARFWTDTRVSQSNRERFIYGFSSNHDDILQDESVAGEYYSIRLVKDIDGNDTTNNITNVLGNTYNVINISEINQAWIGINLNYNTKSNTSRQYAYDYDDVTYDCYIINQWNGKYWERKELNDGDEISVKENNKITNYVYLIDDNGNGQLIKGATYTLVNDTWKMTIDGGTY